MQWVSEDVLQKSEIMYLGVRAFVSGLPSVICLDKAGSNIRLESRMRIETAQAQGWTGEQML